MAGAHEVRCSRRAQPLVTPSLTCAAAPSPSLRISVLALQSDPVPSHGADARAMDKGERMPGREPRRWRHTGCVRCSTIAIISPRDGWCIEAHHHSTLQRILSLCCRGRFWGT